MSWEELFRFNSIRYLLMGYLLYYTIYLAMDMITNSKGKNARKIGKIFFVGQTINTIFFILPTPIILNYINDAVFITLTAKYYNGNLVKNIVLGLSIDALCIASEFVAGLLITIVTKNSLSYTIVAYHTVNLVYFLTVVVPFIIIKFWSIFYNQKTSTSHITIPFKMGVTFKGFKTISNKLEIFCGLNFDRFQMMPTKRTYQLSYGVH